MEVYHEIPVMHNVLVLNAQNTFSKTNVRHTCMSLGAFLQWNHGELYSV